MQKSVIHLRFLAAAGFFVAGTGRPRLRCPRSCFGAGFHGLLGISVEQGLIATRTHASASRHQPPSPRPPSRGRARGRPPTLHGRAALPPPRAALTAEFVSDPSRELLGNLAPGSGCKRKRSEGSVGTSAGRGRLVRHPALLPRNPLPSRAAPRRAGLEPPSVPADPAAPSLCHKGGSGDRAALPQLLRGSVEPVAPGCSAPSYLCRGSRRPRTPPRPRRARSRSRGLPWRRRTGGAGAERRAAAQAA